MNSWRYHLAPRDGTMLMLLDFLGHSSSLVSLINLNVLHHGLMVMLNYAMLLGKETFIW